jgi:uncharacterized protein (TIGR00369 family)
MSGRTVSLREVRESFAQQGLMGTLGAEISSLEPGACEIQAPFRPGLSQQDGFFHAGVTGAIGDSACGYAAFSLAPEGSSVLTVEYKLNLLRPAAGSVLKARAKVVKPGKTLSVCQAEITVESEGAEKLCALLTATIMFLPAKGAGA